MRARDANGVSRGVAAALLLGSFNIVAIAILAARTLRPEPDLGVAAVVGAAALFAIAEAATVWLDISGVSVGIVLRSTPLLIGLIFARPPELLAAQVLGMSAGLLLIRRRPAREAVPLVAIGAVATAAAAGVFAAILGDAGRGAVRWWVASWAAAEMLAVGCALAAAMLAKTSRTPRSIAVTTVFVGLAAVVDASLGMTVVVFLSTEPAELWLLAGPMVVAAATYRAWTRLRNRQARVELLYACAQVFDGQVNAAAMITSLLETVRQALDADVAEILIEESGGSVLRAAVGPGGAVEPLDAVPAEPLAQRRSLIAPSGGAAVLRSDGEARALLPGLVARFDRPGTVSGAIALVARPDRRPFRGEDQALIAAVAGVVADALSGERMTAELAASRAELHQLAALVEGSDDAIVGVDRAGMVTNWNPAAAALFGETADDIVGRPATMLAIGDPTSPLGRAFRAARSGELTRDILVDARRADGSVIPVSATVSPVRSGDDITGVSVIARDATARMVQDTAIREGLDRFEGAFDGSPLGMGVIDADFAWVRVNAALCRPLGAPEWELIGRRFEQGLVREDVEAAHGLVSRVLRGEIAASSTEVRFRNPGGAPIVATFTVRPLRVQGRAPQVLCTVEDITERRAAELRSRASMARVQQAAIELTRIRLPDDVLRAAVAAAREATGAAAAAIRLPAATLGAPAGLVGDDDASGLLAVLEEQEPLLVLGLDKGATRLPAGDPLRARPFADPRLHSFLGVPVPLGGGANGTLLLLNKLDAPEFSEDDVEAAEALALQAGISYDNAMAHERALALVRDLDAANEALREATTARLRFLANVSHELRTPLHAIMLSARLLEDHGTASTARVKALPESIESSGRYLLGLVDDLIDLSRLEVAERPIEPLELEIVPLVTGVRNQLAGLADEKGVRLELETQVSFRVRVDPLRFHQVLVNLVSNSIKYTPAGGLVVVATALLDGAPAIIVRDTGIGMAPEHIERAFEPFERLDRAVAPGAGLGLPIARRIVELHGGTLTATSTLGEGSVFTIALPPSSLASPSPPPPPRGADRARPGRTAPTPPARDGATDVRPTAVRRCSSWTTTPTSATSRAGSCATPVMTCGPRQACPRRATSSATRRRRSSCSTCGWARMTAWTSWTICGRRRPPRSPSSPSAPAPRPPTRRGPWLPARPATCASRSTRTCWWAW
ncbi:MAG: PAS domain-containing sensor histidine kinase [Chloroflexota bacterium]